MEAATARGPAGPRAHDPAHDTLTGEQRSAVTHGAGALLVFAGPGSGKTRTLTARIAHLLASGRARPQEILALTFTVRAADEMRIRLVALVGHDRAAGVTVATFHALCARLLRPHAQLFGRSSAFSIYDQSDVVRIVRDLLADDHHGGDDDEVLAAGLTEQIALAKSRLASPSTVRAVGGPRGGARLAALWGRVDAELAACNAFDFADLVTHGVRLLREHPPIRAAYRRRWRHVLVDEFQDTDPAQLALLAALSGPSGGAPQGSLMVVGDDDQAVFGWRGAAVENLLDFERSFPCAARLVLSRNFRCRPVILEAAARCISHNTRRQPKALLADRAAGGELRVVAFRNDHAEAAWLTKRIGATIAAGTDPREILVLCRSLRWTQPLQQALTAAGIAHRVIGARSLWERVEVKDALAHVALVANPSDTAAFRRAVAAPTDREQFRKAAVAPPSRGSGPATQRAIIEHARAAQIDLLEACMRADTLAIRAPAKEGLVRFGDELSSVGDALEAEGMLAKAVIRAISVSGGPVAAYQLLLDAATDQRTLRDTARVLEDLRSLCRAAHTYERQSGSAATLAGFLEQTRVEDVEPLTVREDRRLTIATIHSAKGTEAEAVFVLGCEERRLPSRQAIESDDPFAVEEERRLFYVAATRAKDRLVLTTGQERSGSPTAGSSRFLAEAELFTR
ncbi:MAG: ATP-dependent helicase [Solirubrobacteraceae bacterium]|nr:ATP-dependent helicase [Solirubrobacteraceae bacterium]